MHGAADGRSKGLRSPHRTASAGVGTKTIYLQWLPSACGADGVSSTYLGLQQPVQGAQRDRQRVYTSAARDHVRRPLPQLEPLNVMCRMICITPTVLSGKAHLGVISRMDTLVYGAYLAGSTACFLVSAVYHQFGPANAQLLHQLQTLDMSLILVLIGCSFVPPMHVAFSCPQHQPYGLVYTLTIISVIVACLALSFLAPVWNTSQYDNVRSCTYAAVVLFAIVPALHWCMLVPFEEAMFGLYRLLVGLAIYGLGFLAFMSHVPERYFQSYVPISFIGSSHNIWHVLTATGAFWILNSTIEYHNFKSAHSCEPTINSYA